MQKNFEKSRGKAAFMQTENSENAEFSFEFEIDQLYRRFLENLDLRYPFGITQLRSSRRELQFRLKKIEISLTNAKVMAV